MRESMQFAEFPPFPLILSKTFYLALYFWTGFFQTVKYVLYILKALLNFWLRLKSSTHLFAESECRINGTWRNTGTVFLKEFFKSPLCAIFFVRFAVLQKGMVTASICTQRYAWSMLTFRFSEEIFSAQIVYNHLHAQVSGIPCSKMLIKENLGTYKQ